MTDSIHFSVRYDGPALFNHTMDVRELAPALVALSDLFEGANKAAFPNAPDVRVKVSGNFKAGSFGIDLAVVQTFAEQVVSLLSGKGSTAIANLTAIVSALGITGGGLFGLIKWLRGRKPSAIRTQGESVVFECQTGQETETFEVDLVAGKLYQSRVVRQSLVKVLKPLEREGIDMFEAGRDNDTTVQVRSEELDAFVAAAEGEEVVSEHVAENILLQIESASFRDGNKWRFSKGGAPFYAEITDTEFLGRVDAGEKFGKLDMLRVDLQVTQLVTDNGLKERHVVSRVHEHRDPLNGEQGSLIG